MTRLGTLSTALCALAALSGCAELPPVPTAARVELDRFMGDWYVVANIPTPFEKGAHNAVESYRLGPDGRVETTFSYRDGGFDGPLKTVRATGYVRDHVSNAVWGMQFIWPFEADYRVLYVSPDYGATVVGRQRRDYVWVMARTPVLDEDTWARLRAAVGEAGYDPGRLELVPQRWAGDPGSGS